MKTFGFAALVAALALGSAAQAGVNLVTNGGFETNAGAGELGVTTSVTGWSTATPNYTFLFPAGSADTTGSNGQFGNVTLWGPGNGVANGLPAASPDGGAFIGMDSDFQTTALSQTITGLTKGQKYTLSFWWAAGQQFGFTGATTDDWQVSFGGETQSTATVNVASHGFSPWQQETMTFTADGTSDTLSFLAQGGPPVPPFALLDGVSLTADVPEPAIWAMMVVGFFGLGFVVRRQRRQAAFA